MLHTRLQGKLCNDLASEPWAAGSVLALAMHVLTCAVLHTACVVVHCSIWFTPLAPVQAGLQGLKGLSRADVRHATASEPSKLPPVFYWHTTCTQSLSGLASAKVLSGLWYLNWAPDLMFMSTDQLPIQLKTEVAIMLCHKVATAATIGHKLACLYAGFKQSCHNEHETLYA